MSPVRRTFCARGGIEIKYIMLHIRINSKYLGIVYIVISAFFFALMNLFVSMAGDVPVMQKAFFRNIVALVLASVMLLKNRSAVRTGKGHVGDLLIRAVAGSVGVLCNFYAISNMNIADASILNKLSPFFAIIFSFLLLKEKPAKTEWLAVAIAFVGALFVVKPSFSSEALPAAAGVLGGLGAGVAYTFVHKMGRAGVSGNLIIFVFSVVTCLITFPSLFLEPYRMSWQQLGVLLLAGVAAAVGQIFITKAYSKSPAKEISVYDYSIVIFTALLGFCFLSEIPDGWSVLGYCVIIFAAVGNWYMALRRERRKERSEQKAEALSDVGGITGDLPAEREDNGDPPAEKTEPSAEKPEPPPALAGTENSLSVKPKGKEE